MAVMVSGWKRGDWSRMRPDGETKPLTPVLAARTRLRRVSTARKTVMANDWCGALELPYHA
ncbi:MAG TPA: hypothetical protein ENH16_03425, partial [Desulfobacteraceae bacterium]|nr:hypothetical protein [Desulfobacteraceae bacterium]